MKLLIATRNRQKLAEIMAILAWPGVEPLSAADVPGLPEVDEDGATFDENAVKKAVTLALASGMWTLADDSGLEVESLDGAPGVYSARYAGEPVDYGANNRKLLTSLRAHPNRRARFRCVLALSDPAGRSETVAGECGGIIVDEPQGDRGFGYDPVFRPDGYDMTFAEMDPDLKNRISHRGQALLAARTAWAHRLHPLGAA